MELTTLEAIRYCIEEGIEGAEKRLQSFERRGRIDNSSVLEALIRDLKMIHVSVSLKTDEEGEMLKGKKRRFLLGEKRSERAERIDDRKNNGAIREAGKSLLDELVFKAILELEKTHCNDDEDIEVTTTQLIKKYAFVNPATIEHKTILKLIQENIFGEANTVYAHSITEYIRAYIRDTNRNILTSSLKELESTDRIAWSFKYYISDVTGHNDVSEEDYLEKQRLIKAEIEEYNSLNETNYSINALQKIRAKESRFLKPEERELLKYINETCPFMVYRRNVIRVLKRDCLEVSSNEAQQIFADILLKRIKKDYLANSSQIDGSFFDRNKSFLLAKYIETLEVILPQWCTDYFSKYTSAFGEITFHTELLTEEEKSVIGLGESQQLSYRDISAQLPF
ncbi:hypothetical protein [Lysinibacillus tabacifolii]|uniref:Uncharacterized protein n=1 Tax=Lysinibacillus tabacifolii TaxID=1173107 RepID=A0ABY2SSG9_9BACI|nr:hypothetical protein [Lysinibacillus tabacifolii]TKI44841.1 hypothetical protein FC748_20945 [Lysinibacillus tabacifolii]